MKTFKYILLLISVSLLYACSKDENDLYKEERSSLLSSTQIGIYQNGKALLLFDKQAHQYYCNPSQALSHTGCAREAIHGSSTECPSLGARKDRRESGRKHGYQARRDNTVIYSPIRRTVCMAMVG
ncbi:MAG: hypothetical protein ACLVEU_12125 [Bacteroides cellulosilyticus]